jgi:hypothetical protein
MIGQRVRQWRRRIFNLWRIAVAGGRCRWWSLSLVVAVAGDRCRWSLSLSLVAIAVKLGGCHLAVMEELKN